MEVIFMQHKGILLATYVLVIVGALNLGLMGLLDVNLLEAFLSGSPVVLKMVYILIGASAVYDILIARGVRKTRRK